MKVILCGYHWAGCKALDFLLEKNYEVYVYTHKTENSVADLHGYCKKKGVPVSLETIKVDNMPFRPDVICSIFYRKLIDSNVIEKVSGKIFNLHCALLPKYRGCSSVPWAMINGERETGFTYHYIDDGCDTGNIIIQETVKIEDFDTQLTLYNRLMFVSMGKFLEALQLVIDGYEGVPQRGESSYHRRGCPDNGIINPNWDDKVIERFIRAMIYPPYPAATLNGNKIETFEDYEAFCK